MSLYQGLSTPKPRSSHAVWRPWLPNQQVYNMREGAEDNPSRISLFYFGGGGRTRSMHTWYN